MADPDLDPVAPPAGQDTPAGPDVTTGPTAQAGRRWSTRQVLAVTAALALVPALRMAWMIRGAPRLQYADYWPMIVTVLRPDGGIDLGGVAEFRNEHPVMFAKVLYWLNVQVTAGSNVALGGVVIGIVLLQVVLIGLLGRRTGPSERRVWPVLVVAASVLLFARQGLWHFYLAMSGTAWLTANLFAIAALVAQHRRRTGLMVLAAVAASVSYGTGLAVWPALIVAGTLRDRNLWRQWYLGALGVVTFIWYRSVFVEINRDTVGRPPPMKALRQILEVIGGHLYPQDRAVSVPIGGAIVLTAIVAVGTFAWRRLRGGEDRGGSAWTGLVAYALGGAVLIGAARDNIFVSFTASRYAAIGGLILVAVLGLLAAVVPALPRLQRAPGWWGAVAVLPLLVAVTLAGGTREAEMRRGAQYQDLLAISLHLDIASESSFWLGGLGRMPADIEELLRASEHIPFDGSFDLDCGRLGTTIDADEVAPLPPGMSAGIESWERERLIAALGTQGWVDPGDASVRCVVIADSAGTVVGAAGIGEPADGYATVAPVEGALLFRGLAVTEESQGTVYVQLEGDDRLLEVPPA
jgi:hypothetical protein